MPTCVPTHLFPFFFFFCIYFIVYEFSLTHPFPLFVCLCIHFVVYEFNFTNCASRIVLVAIDFIFRNYILKTVFLIIKKSIFFSFFIRYWKMSFSFISLILLFIFLFHSIDQDLAMPTCVPTHLFPSFFVFESILSCVSLV